MDIRAALQHAWRWATKDADRSFRYLSWLGLALALGWIACFGTDAGLSYDEIAQRQYGDMIVDWYKSDFQDKRATTFFDLWLYGGFFDTLCQLITRHLPFDIYAVRHIITALTALLGVVATWKLAARIGGARAGFIAACVLVLTPCWTGHGLFNPKDIPFGTAAAFASFGALRLLLGPAPLRIVDLVWAGVASGIALAIRPGGIFVLGYPCAAGAARLAFEFVRRWRAGEWRRSFWLLANLVVCFVVIVPIAWSIMLSTWPWAQLDPLHRPFEAMRIASHFEWHATVRFEGRMIDADKLPLRYLAVWFRMTLPETYLLAAFAGCALLVRAVLRRRLQLERALGVAFIASCVIAPYVAVLIKRPVLYDAQRHLLFLVPPSAALAGCALSEFLAAAWLPRLARGALAGVLVGVAFLICVDMAQLHPYEYVYINRLSGGLRNQFRRFESEYWSVSYREGMEWAVRELPDRTRITSCDRSGTERLEYYRDHLPGAADKLQIVSDWGVADVILSVRRFDCHHGRGPTLHVITRQDVPLLYVQRMKRDR